MAAIQLKQQVDGKIAAGEAIVGDQGQLAQLIIRPGGGRERITDIDNIGLITVSSTPWMSILSKSIGGTPAMQPRLQQEGRRDLVDLSLIPFENM